jgi:hypothetical protein
MNDPEKHVVGATRETCHELGAVQRKVSDRDEGSEIEGSDCEFNS